MTIQRTKLPAQVMLIIAVLLMPFGIWAQDSGYESDYVAVFTQEELAQMLAPIALYPDSLIARILMASTYPLEVVEAERWLRDNEGLQYDALDDALEDKTWDPSVKSLCHFPDVLYALSEKLDQTRRLGDAYLAQEEDVMETIQTLRRRAEQQGNLYSSGEQTVIRETEYIRIEPADPEVVYVPLYNPVYVYGPWWYPSYPPWGFYHPSHVIIRTGRIVFGSGIYFGLGISSWCWFDWPARHIYVHYDRSPYFRGRYIVPASGRHYWRHNPFHRRGIAYRDRKTSVRFGEHRPGFSSFDEERRGHPGNRRDVRSDDPFRKSYKEQQRTSEERRIMERQNVRTVYPSKTFDKKPIDTSRRIYQERQWKPEPQQKAESVRPRSNQPRETTFQGIGRGNFERQAERSGSETRRSSQPVYQSPGTGRRTGGSGSGIFQRDIGRSVGFRR